MINHLSKLLYEGRVFMKELKSKNYVDMSYTTFDLGMIFFYSFLAIMTIIVYVIDISITVILFLEILSVILMAFFVLRPFAYAFDSDKICERFCLLLAFKIIITIFLNIFCSFRLAFMLDAALTCFFSLLLDNVTNVISKISFSEVISLDGINGKDLKCFNCGSSINKKDKTCPICGSLCIVSKVVVKPTDFDSIYNNSDDKLLEKYIKRELIKANINNAWMPKKDLVRLNVLNFIFSILLFIYISSIFFHLPIYMYILCLVLLIIFFKISRSYNLIK